MLRMKISLVPTGAIGLIQTMPCLHQYTYYSVELCVAVSCSHDDTIQHCPLTGCICNPATAACCWHAAAADRLLLKCVTPGGWLL
jgi:hypothetical protein